MWVMRILGDCPSCAGRDSFGNVSVQRDRVLRGCTACPYSETVPLPPVRKKVLYLDQFFFSHAFKAGDARFNEAARRIAAAADAQVLAAPFSSIHEDETHQWRGYAGKSKDDLMEFIKRSSRGAEFRPAYDVEHEQIFRSFHRFLDGAPAPFAVEERDALKDDLHRWDDYLWIDVGHYLGDIEQMRTLKSESVERLVKSVFPDWRTSTSTFDEDVANENRAGARAYLEAYQDYMERMARGDYNAMFDSPILSTVVSSMLRLLPRYMDIRTRIQRVHEYFGSDHFAQTPYHWIASRAFAVLKHMVKNGAYAKPDRAQEKLSGFFQDVRHVSTYAPYCDAFVLDQAMAALMSDPRIALEQNFHCKVFSLNNWPEFLDWLERLVGETSDEHKRGLAAAYP